MLCTATVARPAAWPPRGRASCGLAPSRTCTAPLAGRQSVQPGVRAAGGRGRLPITAQAGKNLGGQGKAAAASILQSQAQQLRQLATQMQQQADMMLDEHAAPRVSSSVEETQQLQQRVQKQEEQLQRQEEWLAAMLWHQRIVAGGLSGRKVFTFSCTMPLDRWLPDKGILAVAGPTQWDNLPGLCLQVYSLPMQDRDRDYGYGNAITGFELRLVLDKTPSCIDDLGLTIPIIYDQGSSVELLRDDDPDGDNYSFVGQIFVGDDPDDERALLSRSHGEPLWLSRIELHRLGLLSSDDDESSYDDDVVAMQSKATGGSYYVLFNMKLCIGG